MGYQYCTYFDSNYFLRGLALYHSLRKHEPGSVLWVLCLDQATYDNFIRLDYPGLKPIALSELEKADPALLTVKSQRSKVEYYWTCGPSWLKFVMDANPDAPGVTYMDGDLFVFDCLEPIYRELGADSILIHEHRFSEDAEKQSESLGRFNVGTLVFRNDADGRTCLEWWRERCLEWCRNVPENGKFGDQKYLESFSGLFRKVRILSHVGVGVASWNVATYHVHFRGDAPMVDEWQVLVYHFQGIHILGPSVILNFGIRNFTIPLRKIYSTYAAAIAFAWDDSRIRGVVIHGKQLDAKKKLHLGVILRTAAAGKVVFSNAFLTILLGFPGTLLRKLAGK